MGQQACGECHQRRRAHPLVADAAVALRSEQHAPTGGWRVGRREQGGKQGGGGCRAGRPAVGSNRLSRCSAVLPSHFLLQCSRLASRHPARTAHRCHSHLAPAANRRHNYEQPKFTAPTAAARPPAEPAAQCARSGAGCGPAQRCAAARWRPTAPPPGRGGQRRAGPAAAGQMRTEGERELAPHSAPSRKGSAEDSGTCGGSVESMLVAA